MQADRFANQSRLPNSSLGNDAGTGHSRTFDEDSLAAVRTKLEEVARSQEMLREAREMLLVERSQVRATGEAVHKQRTATGDAEVQFMNHLRAFVHEHDKDLPDVLVAAYDQVIDQRDKLGAMEEEYLQAERTLGGSEWTFGQKERVFYQYDIRRIVPDDDKSTTPYGFQHNSVAPRQPIPQPPLPPPPVLDENVIIVHGAPPPPPPPPPPLEITATFVRDAPSPPPPANWPHTSGTVHQLYQAALTDLDQLRRDFNSLRSQQSRLLDISPHRSRYHPDATLKLSGHSNFYNTYSELLGKMAECEVKVQHLKQESMRYETLHTLLSRRMSDPIHMDKRAASPLGTITRAQTDGVLPTALDNASIKLRIREWLLDYMKNSTVERAMYVNILEAVGIPVSEMNPLEECAVQYWPLGSSDQSPDTMDEPPSPTEPSEQDYASSPLQRSHKQHKVSMSSHKKATLALNEKLIESLGLEETELYSMHHPSPDIRMAPGLFDKSSVEIATHKDATEFQFDLLGLASLPQHASSPMRNCRESVDGFPPLTEQEYLILL
jgi:hypothetical protein